VAEPLRYTDIIMSMLERKSISVLKIEPAEVM